MNTDTIARQYNADGYAIVRGVFSPAEIAEIDRELTAYIRDIVPTLGSGDVYYEDAPGKPIKSLFRLDQRSEFFRKLTGDARILQILHALWPGAEIELELTAFFGKAAHSGSVTPPHQDNAFHNYHPPEDLVCTIAIDKSTPANGALTVQKGSHKLGLLPHRPSGVMGFSQTLIDPIDETKYPAVQICMHPGDISLHHTNTIHSSGANTTPCSRRQLGLVYRSTRAVRDEAARARYQAELKKLHDQKNAPAM